MIRSMTGFGTAELETDDGEVRAEVRSVNNRHLKVSFRLPERASPWESELRAVVAERLARGTVDVRVSVGTGEGDGEGVTEWELDQARVRAYLDAFRTLREEYNLPGQIDLGLLLRAGEVLRPARPPEPDWLTLEQARRAMLGALERLVEMRGQEGERLAEDLRARVAGLRAGADEVRLLAPDRLRRERERLRAAVRELAEGLEPDQERLEREIAVLADKWDLGEELVRASAHLDAFEEYLDAPAEEPVGKRLAFLTQELHREINTMGAKANDARISRVVVEMKNELEKVREQVENVE